MVIIFCVTSPGEFDIFLSGSHSCGQLAMQPSNKVLLNLEMTIYGIP